MNVVGLGFDVHRSEGAGFYLGGIKVRIPKRGKGHSDADVLIHTNLRCTFLGALQTKGQLAFIFLQQNAIIKGIDSQILLKECGEIVEKIRIHNWVYCATMLL